MDQPIITVKPNVFAGILWLIILDLIVSLVFGISTGAGISILMGLIIFVLAFVFFFIFIYFHIMSLKNTQYLFYKDRIEYYEGFLNQVKKTLAYNKVTDCVLNKSVYERMLKVGTIILLTAGQGTVSSGVRLTALENPDQLYEQLLELLEIKK